ncbi:MAG: 30S ribosomal protein S6 [Alphaproteobacteria bacterium]
MPFYETVYIARQDLTETQVKDITEGFAKIITDANGKVHKTEFWGLKNFAYRINKARKGHYILLELDVDADTLHEMERQMRLHEDVVRFQTLRIEELSEGPSVMMDKGGRDDDKKKFDRKFDKKFDKKKEAA